MARPLRPYPPPLDLNGHRKIIFIFKWQQNKKRLKKSSFFHNGPAFTPHPLLMAWPLAEELFLRLPLGEPAMNKTHCHVMEI